MSTGTPSDGAHTPRVSTSDRPDQGPIPIFELHLKYLQDSYLNFFQERAKIEDSYIDSLLKLHKKTKTVDVYLDFATEPSTLRQAWSEIRDGIEREAQSRSAFVAALVTDVINPIASLKDTQDRTRKRIKDGLKESINAHQDYADNVLPRLKRAYFKKCQEAEDNKATASGPPGVTDPSTVLSPTRSNPNTSPVVTNPQPLRPLSRRASGHHPQARNRSPPASNNPLHDLAHQGKRQLNQLMTFLDNKGGSLKEGVSGSRGDAAIRSVRAKRESDEADKEYRKGVHWLETLRIQRYRVMESAFNSLELFIEETSTQMKHVLEKYTSNMVATSTTIAHLATHSQSFVTHISPHREVSFLAALRNRYLKQSTPKRALYTNYYVGDCNDLIFGVGLVDYATSRGLQEGEIPKLVRLCIAEVDKRGLNSEGIYRVSGRHAVVQEMMHKVERDERNFQFYQADDVFVIASLLKQYLRDLPEPVFKFALEDRLKHSEEFDDHKQNNFIMLRGRMRRLPTIHQATLKAIIEHLARVAANSEKNKMDSKNLAIIFASVIFGEDELPKGNDLLLMQSTKDSLMEDMINFADVLFDDRAMPPNAPPKPTTPPSETNTPSPPGGSPRKRPDPEPQNSTDSDYRSHYRRISESLLQSPVEVPPHTHVEVPPHTHVEVPPHTQDFTPELPPRPSYSIHPSHRATNASSRSTDSDETSEGPPPLPARPSHGTGARTSLDTRALRTSEGSGSGSQASPTSDHHDHEDSADDTALTTPSAAPSSPTSVRSPLALQSELSTEGPSPTSVEAARSHEHEHEDAK